MFFDILKINNLYKVVETAQKLYYYISTTFTSKTSNLYFVNF